MLLYRIPDLDDEYMRLLASLQIRVDGAASRSDKYELARTSFAAKSPRRLFDEVKRVLSRRAPNGDSCYYCERDRYRDVEHIKPKRHYPEECFVWRNYVYACVICNQDEKKDTYAVIDAAGELIEFNRSHSIDDPLPVGVDAFIDVRNEDPLESLWLDLDTGIFVCIGDTVSKLRADFTLRLLGLNQDDMARHRRAAFKAYKNYFGEYSEARRLGDVDRSARVLSELKMLSHPTVLVEMRRQMPGSAELTELFLDVPDDVGARPL